MNTAQEHYERLLADIYTWMSGGFDNSLARNRAFFDNHQITPSLSKIAIDLGAGCGFQSIPLAEKGFSVLAIDTSDKLLKELESRADGLAITTINDDMLNLDKHFRNQVELIACMVDSLLHLPSHECVATLFNKIYQALEPGGKLILTFRDLSAELFGLDRFIPVKSDNDNILTCFLEYEESSVKVHDILYSRSDDKWSIKKSFYHKLRLSEQQTANLLIKSGLDISVCLRVNGMVTIIAKKS